jgi:hypothetical protein
MVILVHLTAKYERVDEELILCAGKCFDDAVYWAYILLELLVAIVLNPALSMDASGNLGPICYSRWRSQKIARARTTLVVTPSTAQIIYENNLTSISQAWGQTLSAAQRQLWNKLAMDQRRYDRLGQPRVPSGYEVFTSRNLIRLTGGYTITTSPILRTKTVFATGLTAVWVSTTSYVWVVHTFSTGASTPDFMQVWRAGPFTSPARNPIKPEYRFIGFKKPVAGYADYAVTAGLYYWYKCRFCDANGLALKWFEVQILTS